MLDKDVETRFRQAVANLLKPYDDKINYLTREHEKDTVRIRELEHENLILTVHHEDSGLERDAEKNCKYVLIEIKEGQFAGQTRTEWICPICRACLGNWEKYCPKCGQRVKRAYTEEDRISDGQE